VGETALYVVRVWRETEGFRAAVRRVEDEDTRLFDDATEVARYLEASALATQPTSAPVSSDLSGAVTNALDRPAEPGGRR